MIEKNAIKQNYSLSQKELSTVDDYRKLRKTSVLTVMFTDIKGFTNLTETKGEVFSAKVRKIHNQLLIPIIEENNDGLIVKHIGDSIMSVFSEPSTAVARAIEINSKIIYMQKELLNILFSIMIIRKFHIKLKLKCRLPEKKLHLRNMNLLLTGRSN